MVATHESCEWSLQVGDNACWTCRKSHLNRDNQQPLEFSLLLRNESIDLMTYWEAGNSNPGIHVNVAKTEGAAGNLLWLSKTCRKSRGWTSTRPTGAKVVVRFMIIRRQYLVVRGDLVVTVYRSPRRRGFSNRWLLRRRKRKLMGIEEINRILELKGNLP